MADPSEIGAVWRAETRRAGKSARGLALMVLFLFAEALTLGVGGCINVGANKQFDEIVTGQGAEPAVVRKELTRRKVEILKMVTRNSDATVETLAEVPLVLLLVFFATLLFLPILIALMGFDQISAEIGPKSIRYLVVRAQRSSVLFGKYLSQLTVLALLMVICVLAMVGVAKWLNADFEWLLAAKWAAKLWAASMVIGATYAALTTLCSSVVRIGPLSLFLNLISLFVFWFIGLVSNVWSLPGAKGLLGQEESPLAYIRYLLPSQFETQVLSPAPLEFASGLVAFAGFTLVFLGLARMVLDWRDV
ncbi:MAG: ABC transporter permease [Myxococcota bacterium]